MNSRVISAVAILGLAAAGAGVLTTGAFQKDGVVVTDHFVGGSFDLANNPVTVALDVPNLQPGDVYYQAFPLSNAGTIDLRYAMFTTLQSIDAIAEQVQLVVKPQAAGSDTCKAGPAFDADTTEYTGPSSNVATGFLDLFGNRIIGAQAGDRELAPGAAEVQCVQITYPAATNANTFAGQVLDLDIRFDAEQIANNP